MKNCLTVDIENLLQAYLNANRIKACAPPVPVDLDAGQVIVTRTGGQERSYVQDVHFVSVDCYGDTAAGAMALACLLTEELRNLSGKFLGDVPVYESGCTALPYNNPDPNHQTLARATFSVQIVTRVKHT